ncbi:MAG: DUF2986 domain-containing protein [Colwellia sp.]|nr:DUF2986 domain-containing protein [Colwellia sp.]
MNRKKKINQALKKRVKKTNSKLHTSNKPKYISKADRAKIAAEKNSETDNDNEQSES